MFLGWYELKIFEYLKHYATLQQVASFGDVKMR
jgi:hypothetical protein